MAEISMNNITMNALSDKTGLSNKVKQGSFFVILSNIIASILRLIRTSILARLLLPVDFGLFAIAQLVIRGVGIFSDFGFRQALIQKNVILENTYLDSTWVTEIIRGIIVGGIIFLFAPAIAGFFENPDLIKILRLISLAPILSGFVNIGVMYFEKDLAFSKYFIFEQITTISNFGFSIIFALIFKNVLALVLGYIISLLTMVIFSYLLNSYSPTFKIHIAALREMFHFGKYIFIIGIMTYVMTQIDNLMVGRLVGIDDLGIYYMAWTIALLPDDGITALLSKVTFPAYSKIQRDLEKLKIAFLRGTKLTCFLVVPLVFIIFVLIPDIVKYVLGIKWIAAVPIVRILCFMALFNSYNHIISPLFMGIGKPWINSRAKIIEFFIFILLIYPLVVKYGLIGAAMSGTFAYTMGFICRLLLLRKISIELPMKFIMIQSKLLIISLLYYYIIYNMNIYFNLINTLLSFIIWVSIIGILSYVTCILFDREIKGEVLEQIKAIMHKKRVIYET
jgi:O-antigen/teichoic acid export membrane protein